MDPGKRENGFWWSASIVLRIIVSVIASHVSYIALMCKRKIKESILVASK